MVISTTSKLYAYLDNITILTFDNKLLFRR